MKPETIWKRVAKYREEAERLRDKAKKLSEKALMLEKANSATRKKDRELENRKRYAEVFRAVASGSTYRHAGSLVGVSPSRSREIVLWVMRRLRHRLAFTTRKTFWEKAFGCKIQEIQMMAGKVSKKILDGEKRREELEKERERKKKLAAQKKKLEGFKEVSVKKPKEHRGSAWLKETVFTGDENV